MWKELNNRLNDLSTSGKLLGQDEKQPFKSVAMRLYLL